MSASVTIRRAELSDSPALQDIERAAGEQFRTVGMDAIADDDPFSDDELAAYVAGGRSWVAVDGGDRAVGYLVVDLVDGHAHIEQVSVVPERQGQGIGRRLVDHVAVWAAGEQLGALTLTTFTDVPWNRPLYERLGFRVLREDETGPELRALRATEATHGLDPRIRVCMRRDCDLYARSTATLLASWVEIAQGASRAAVLTLDGVHAAVFPAGPERDVYNNALLHRGFGPDGVDTMERTYAEAGVDRYAAWVHERDEAGRAELVARGYTLTETTSAMGMSLDQLTEAPAAHPEIDIGPVTWTDYLQYLHAFGLPPDLLAGTDPHAFHVVGASRSGRIVATALAYHHDGDCGVFNVSTLEGSRRQGIGTALTARLLSDARARGCLTATLQSTPMAEQVYAAVGFHGLGRILEHAKGTTRDDRALVHRELTTAPFRRGGGGRVRARPHGGERCPGPA